MARTTILKIFLFITILSFSNLLFAVGKELETPLPNIPGIPSPTVTDSSLVLYVSYIYQLAIVFSGFLIFVILIIGGWKYLFSAGNPAKRLAGRKQIISALLGFIIILGSYMILNTINPGILDLPKINLMPFDSFVSDNPGQVAIDQFTQGIKLGELPIGALITSEYSVSSFFDSTTSTDPIVDLDNTIDYIDAFPEEKSYPSNFQGALHGRRLKRILEVASTTYSMATSVLDKIVDDLDYSLSYLQGKMATLSLLASTCSCAKCANLLCTAPILPFCPCELCNNMLDPCGVIERVLMENIQEEIPTLYDEYELLNDGDSKTNPTSIIPCKTLELEYASRALLNFAIQGKYIDSPEANSSDSFYNSQEAKDLRDAINECESKLVGGRLMDPIIDEIEKQIEIASTTENKGDWNPTSTIAERDISTNFNELKTIYDSLIDIKEKMDPFSVTAKYVFPISFVQLEQVKINTQIFEQGQAPSDFYFVLKTSPYTITFTTQSSIKNEEITTLSSDPATFYYLNVASVKNENNSFPKSFLSWLTSHIEIARAADTISSYNIESMSKTQCTPLVEIPIGNATDEALKLIEDIMYELSKTQNNITSLPEKISQFKKNQESLYDATNDLIKKTKDCKSQCIGTCSCSCGLPVMIPCEVGLCCGSCGCTCSGQVCPIDLLSTIAKFELEYIKTNLSLQDIINNIQEIITSFRKLNSEERLNIDICCNNEDGNCRDKVNPDKYTDDIEDKDYTLMEKLFQVQLLLNRSRQISKSGTGDLGRASDYEILIAGMKKLYDTNNKPVSDIEEPSLMDMAYPTKEFQSKLMTPTPGDRAQLEVPLYLDLSNCGYKALSVGKIEPEQSEENLWILLDARTVRGENELDAYQILSLDNKTECTPDPLLDCYYYIKDSSGKYKRSNPSPYNCYSYIKSIKYKETTYPTNTRIPAGGNLANNWYCCVLPSQTQDQ